ncbi:hypothetical protein TNCV_4562311 [Trichonephila clavipes]|nr:hypothetical protein TNCV_4562311 [Trichonephila clavipes]
MMRSAAETECHRSEQVDVENDHCSSLGIFGTWSEFAGDQPKLECWNCCYLIRNVLLIMQAIGVAAMRFRLEGSPRFQKKGSREIPCEREFSPNTEKIKGEMEWDFLPHRYHTRTGH